MDTPIVIGLEVHVQLKTKTKLFCSCPTFTEEPNTAICPTCLGHPGSKPVINEKALEYGAKLAIALGCKIAPHIQFARKTYFYPDLVKNYQITQQDDPLGSDGQIILDDGKVVRIARCHLEEDPGALIRETNSVLADYNRSGIALCEIVTSPDMTSPAEAREFLKKLMNILGYLGIFDQDTCIIKADANVSIKEKKYTRVEIKNITGFKEIERALNYEVERQKTQEVKKETRGWDDVKGITYSMRSKEEEADYGYIVEPDLPTFHISEEWINSVRSQIPELAQARAARWIKEWQLDTTDANVIASDIEVADLYEEIAKKVNPKTASHWVRREVLRLMNDNKQTLKETQFDAKGLIEVLDLYEKKKITNKIAQNIIRELASKKFSPIAYVKENKLETVADEGALDVLCKKVIGEQPKAVEDYKKGEEKSLMFLIGQVMKHTKGTASPQMVRELLITLLK